MEWLGWMGYAGSMVGMFFLARKNPIGWTFRTAASVGWIGFAFSMQSKPLIFTSLSYAVIDVYGLLKGKR